MLIFNWQSLFCCTWWSLFTLSLFDGWCILMPAWSHTERKYQICVLQFTCSLVWMSYLLNCTSLALYSFEWHSSNHVNPCSSTNETNLWSAGNSNSVIRRIKLSCWCSNSISKGRALLQKVSPTPMRKIWACHSVCLSVLGVQCYISLGHVLAPGCVLILCKILS